MKDNRNKGKFAGLLRYKQLAVFFVCVVLSTIMWLFIELMKDYTTDISYSLKFKNVPEGMILTSSVDTLVKVGINAQGYDLLGAKYLKRNRQLLVDIAKVHVTQNANGFSAYIPTIKFKEEIKNQIPFSKSIAFIKPDTLVFKFSMIYKKYLPVKANIEFALNSQYDIIDSVTINPNHITVSSIKDVIDTIRFINTDYYKFNNIDSNVNVTIALNKGIKKQLIILSTDSVNIKFKVAKVTEAVYEIPVQVVPENKDLKIFPDKVKVICRVPLTQYSNINASAFRLQVNHPEANQKKLPIKITHIPNQVKLIRIEPPEVDYILITP